ncbi:hypothetical protein ACFQ4X_07110 [Fictibacillus halophilus]|uniref:hypothetical protein n=1 Tax=Fictibacillus halophilus TaxID=1610490 RepID=UPI00362BA7A2
MNVGTFTLEVDNELLEEFDFEGMLIHPHNQDLGMLVLSSKDDSFTLHIFKIMLQNESYHIENKLLQQTFSTLQNMYVFLESFSTFSSDQFSSFLEQVE